MKRLAMILAVASLMVAGTVPAQADVVRLSDSATFSTIQGAIDDAGTLTGETLTASAGTYGENLTISKDLNILGARSGVDPAGGIDRGSESVITGQVEFTSTGGGATLNGFKLSGNRIWIHGAADVTASHNILVNSGSHGIYIDGSSANAQVLYNTVSSPAWQGISNQGNSGVTISHNYVQGVDTEQPIESTNHTGAGVHITHNVISNSTGAKGINYWGAPGAVISYNQISGTTGEAIFSDTKTNTIEGNVISNTGGPGIQLYPVNVANEAEASVINANTITGTKYQGITVFGQAYTQITGNVLTGCNYYGADGTGDWDYAGIHVEDLGGEASEYSVIRGNTVSDGINGIQTWSSNVSITENNIYDMGDTYPDTKLDPLTGRTFENSGILVGSNWDSGNLDPSGVTVLHNNIYDNYVGVFHSDEMANLVDARYNWWGDATGPSGGLPDPITGTLANGLGDSVDANVHWDPHLQVPVPEPAGLGLIGLALLAVRKRRS